jgi:hypothetical protein
MMLKSSTDTMQMFAFAGAILLGLAIIVGGISFYNYCE